LTRFTVALAVLNTFPAMDDVSSVVCFFGAAVAVGLLAVGAVRLAVVALAGVGLAAAFAVVLGAAGFAAVFFVVVDDLPVVAFLAMGFPPP
jgi:hypothetical protein